MFNGGQKCVVLLSWLVNVNPTLRSGKVAGRVVLIRDIDEAPPTAAAPSEEKKKKKKKDKKSSKNKPMSFLDDADEDDGSYFQEKKERRKKREFAPQPQPQSKNLPKSKTVKNPEKACPRDASRVRS